MSQEDFASGASAARNKLASFLTEHGLKIPLRDRPPEDEDFWHAIQEFAERYGATLPLYSLGTEPSRRFKEGLEAFKRELERSGSRTPATAPKDLRPERQLNSKRTKCRHCGEWFSHRRDKPGYVDECPACLSAISFPRPRSGADGELSARSDAEGEISEGKSDATIGACPQERRAEAPRILAALARVLKNLAKKFT